MTAVTKTMLGSLLAVTLALGAAGCDKNPGEADSAAAEAPPAAMPEGHPMVAAPVQEVDLSGIAPAEGGKTVADLFAQRTELAGQTVALRGKVVKANANIMGMNWLHVRDGSGAEGTNDITITTSSASPMPAVGDTVLVTGPVVIDKDLGMGYQYPVLIEDATVTVETSAQ
ncbi:MAG: hypothetical protein MUC71_10115 [Steroidobacteraceae bacterium]|nr:hypothetical protein [Steroidobacteraceae bacterium]